MDKKSSVGIPIVYFIDFLLAGLYILTSIAYSMVSKGQGLLSEVSSKLALLFSVPCGILLIAIGLLLVKHKSISIRLHILYYSLTAILAILPYFRLVILRLPPIVINFIYSFSFYSTCVMRWIFPQMPRLSYMLISLCIVTFFIQAKVKEEF